MVCRRCNRDIPVNYSSNNCPFCNAPLNRGYKSKFVKSDKIQSSGTNVGDWIVSMGTTEATTLSALDTTTPLTQVFSGAILPKIVEERMEKISSNTMKARNTSI